MKKAIKEIIECALDKARSSGELELANVPDVVIEKPKDEKLGDFATNIAMTLARSEKKNPKVIADIIFRHIGNGVTGLDSVDIAGPGFLNIKMSQGFFLDRLTEAVRQGNDFGTQYRSAIFYTDIKQKEITKIIIKKLSQSIYNNKEIVTKIELAKDFFEAEKEHFKYYDLNPNQTVFIDDKEENIKSAE